MSSIRGRYVFNLGGILSYLVGAFCLGGVLTYNHVHRGQHVNTVI